MNSTTESAERLALRGLLLILVEVQNRLQAGVEKRGLAITVDDLAKAAANVVDEITDLVDSDHAREMVQLARAVLGTDPPAAIPADQAAFHQ